MATNPTNGHGLDRAGTGAGAGAGLGGDGLTGGSPRRWRSAGSRNRSDDIAERERRAVVQRDGLRADPHAVDPRAVLRAEIDARSRRPSRGGSRRACATDPRRGSPRSPRRRGRSRALASGGGSDAPAPAPGRARSRAPAPRRRRAGSRTSSRARLSVRCGVAAGVARRRRAHPHAIPAELDDDAVADRAAVAGRAHHAADDRLGEQRPGLALERGRAPRRATSTGSRIRARRPAPITITSSARSIAGSAADRPR